MQRRQFVAKIIQLFSFTSLITFLESCKGATSSYGGGTSTTQGGDCKVNGTAVYIQDLHTPNHTLTIPAADVVAGVQKTYLLVDNGSGHTHTITVTAADFITLQNNLGIVEVSTADAGHTHNLTINCLHTGGGY